LDLKAVWSRRHFPKKNKLNPLLSLIILLSAASCGLPVYEVLDPPSAYVQGFNTMGFTTSGSDSIDGYVIYYKIYNYGDSLITTERRKFDPSYYDNDDTKELPSGTELPKELHFFPMGYVGVNNQQSETFPHIKLSGGGIVVQFDFSGALDQKTGTDTVLTIGGPVSGSVPARGVAYSNTNFGQYSGQNDSKRFVKNYEFENNSGNLYDDDLDNMKKRYDLDNVSSIEIAFCAISYGISNTNFQPLMSVPVYLGTVQMNNFDDNSQNQPIRD